MEEFENQNIPDTDIPEEPVREPAAYRGNGSGRKESPYANSPYVMEHSQHTYEPRQAYEPRPTYSRPQQQGYYQPHYEKPKPPKKRKNPSGLWKKIISAVAVLALVVGSCAVTANLVNQRWEQETQALENSFNQQLGALQAQIEAQAPASTGNSVSGTVSSLNAYTPGQVYANNVQSVVLIESTVQTSMYGQTATGKSTGSGFVLTEDGYVITNYHVIQGASSVAVRMHDNTVYPAEVVGYDDTNDVAVLKVEAAGLNAVDIGSSTDLIVGDQVTAIGNPLGELTATLTVGYVSAKERDVTTDGTVINMIQTDAAINSGNSGGPLFNMKGEVVGITTAKYSGSSSSGASIEGIGFAIPIDDVMGVIGQLVETGTIQSGYMGVIVQNMDPSTAEVYGLPVGAYVVSVEEDGGAFAAGIQPKDIITKVGDDTIENFTDLTKALRKYKAGDTAMVTVYRAGQELTIPCQLAERPAEAEEPVQVPQETQGNQQMPEGNYNDWYNFFAPFFGFGGSNNNGG